MVLRGNHRQAIFHEEGDRDRLGSLLADSLQRDECEAYAYCWMTNHFHLALRIGEMPLARFVQHVASRYARGLQRSVPTTGHLFERCYRASLVDKQAYLLALIRYIHLNPVRAGIAADPGDYRWSSHRAYLGLAPASWFSLDAGLALFGPDARLAREAYRRFMAAVPDVD